MKSDRVSELYHGRILDKYNQQVCRERVHWMCRQVRGARVLDFGCSQGIAALLLGREGYEVLGVDIDPTVIAEAQQALAGETDYVRAKVRFEPVTAGPLPLPDASFDTILFGEVLEHLAHPEAVLAELQRVCRPEGRLVITTPFGVLRHPDHYATYYLDRFVATVAPYFALCELEVQNKYIHCLAINRPAETPAAVAAPERLLRLSAAAFEAAERKYLERWDALREQYRAQRARFKLQRSKLAEARQQAAAAQKSLVAARRAEREKYQQLLDRLQVEREEALWVERRRHEEARKEILRQHAASAARRDAEHATKLQALERQLRDVRRQLEAEQAAAAAAAADRELLRARLRRQRDQLEYARLELDLREREVRYQLGDKLVTAYYHPAELIRLPIELVRLFRQGRRQQRAREQQFQTETRLLRGTDPQHAHAALWTERGPQPPGRDGNTQPHPAAAARCAKRSPAAPPAPPAAPPAAATASATVAAEPLTFRPPARPARPPRLGMRVGVIMDEFTFECFRDECHLVPFGLHDWQARLTVERPEFLFVESAWRGNEGAWKLQYPDQSALAKVVQWCRAQGIPTVFWNKEDPPNYDRFIHAARLCDQVFTSDENCIPKYRSDLGHTRVAALPFAAQPAIHNPIDSTEPRRGNLCFAGTYYRSKYPDRQSDLDTLLRPARTRGLTIFDRQHGYTKSTAYRFPEEYEPLVRGGLPYAEMLAAYKAYHVFLNVNSVRESPTMFSRRVFELLACGTAVISTPSHGMEQMLGRDAVAVAESEAEAAAWMDRLIADPELRARMVQRGQRRVFAAHTYALRLQTILETLGLPYPRQRRRVSVVTVTNRPAMLANAIANYTRQSYPDKEWIIVLNSDAFRLTAVQEQVAGIPNTRVFQKPEAWTLGACLNFAIDQSDFEFVAKFDDDDFYAEHYLTDQLHAFLYCDCEIVGKRSYLAHLVEGGQVALRFPGWEHRYSKLVSGATLVVRRTLFEEQRFAEDVPRGVDTAFQRACAERGFGVYSTNRFNFVARRLPGAGHTWEISDQEFLDKCECLPAGTDPEAYASV